MFELTPTQARRLALNRQGLHKSNAFGRGESGLSKCIERLGYIQIDTISVVNRAHHHTLWTRIPKYEQVHLDTMQKARVVFEYWSHAAAYLPMSKFRFCLPYMNAIASGQQHWRVPDKKAMRAVLKRIQSEGPLRARDFEAPKNKQPERWGGMKPAKIALEQLFIEGKLMISHRDGFQKVFDLPERVLPADVDTSTPTPEEYCRFLVNQTINAHGIATAAEMGYLRKGIKNDLKNQIEQMLSDGEIIQVTVQGNPNPYFSRTDIVELAASARVAKKVHLLSPFDNLVIQRKRMVHLFDFDYQIECYVTAAKRVHGYFCLPILFGDQLVGRLDPKADRKNHRLNVLNLVIEKEIKQMDTFVNQLARKLKEFAVFNDCDTIVIEKCNHKKIGSAVSRLLK